MVKKVQKIISIVLCFLFLIEQTGFAQVGAQLDIASHLAGLRNSFAQDKFRPLHLRYLQYNPQENTFHLLLDKGDTKELNDSLLEDTSKTLLKYFLIGLSLPNDSFWVNLRPDSSDNIIDPRLEQTDIGKIMLEADLQLKRDTARFTSPETPEGKEYWERLYKKAEELFASEDITIPTLTRPWIVPGEIIIRENKDSAYIYKATLKVMLEQDYLKDSSTYNFKDPRLKALNEYSSQLIRETIIPKLTKEINSSKRYASLRQVYYSLVMAQWFKARFSDTDNFYSYFINRGDLTNLASTNSWSKTTYFEAYQKSFKDGEYNIKEPVYTPFGQVIRSYFSGGAELTMQMGNPGEENSSGLVRIATAEMSPPPHRDLQPQAFKITTEPAGGLAFFPIEQVGTHNQTPVTADNIRNLVNASGLETWPEIANFILSHLPSTASYAKLISILKQIIQGKFLVSGKTLYKIERFIEQQSLPPDQAEILGIALGIRRQGLGPPDKPISFKRYHLVSAEVMKIGQRVREAKTQEELRQIKAALFDELFSNQILNEEEKQEIKDAIFSIAAEWEVEILYYKYLDEVRSCSKPGVLGQIVGEFEREMQRIDTDSGRDRCVRLKQEAETQRQFIKRQDLQKLISDIEDAATPESLVRIIWKAPEEFKNQPEVIAAQTKKERVFFAEKITTAIKSIEKCNNEGELNDLRVQTVSPGDEQRTDFQDLIAELDKAIQARRMGLGREDEGTHLKISTEVLIDFSIPRAVHIEALDKIWRGLSRKLQSESRIIEAIARQLVRILPRQIEILQAEISYSNAVGLGTIQERISRWDSLCTEINNLLGQFKQAKLFSAVMLAKVPLSTIQTLIEQKLTERVQDLKNAIGGANTFEEIDALYAQVPDSMRSGLHENGLRRKAALTITGIQGAQTVVEIDKRIQAWNQAPERSAFVSPPPYLSNLNSTVQEAKKERLAVLKNALLTQIGNANTQQAIDDILRVTPAVLRDAETERVTEKKSGDLFAQRTQQAMAAVQSCTTIVELRGIIANGFTEEEREALKFRPFFSPLAEMAQQRESVLIEQLIKSLENAGSGGIAVLLTGVPEDIIRRSEVREKIETRQRKLHLAEKNTQNEQKVALFRNEFTGRLSKATSDVVINELETELDAKLKQYPNGGLAVFKERVAEKRREVTERQKQLLASLPEGNLIYSPEDIRRMLLGLGYSEDCIFEIATELEKLVQRIDFRSLVEPSTSDRQLVLNLHTRLREEGYLSERRRHLPLFRLLVNGLNRNFTKEDMLAVLDRHGKSDEQEELLACSAISQLVVILLTLSGRRARTAITLNHIFVIQPLENKRVAFIDFATPAMAGYIYKIVDLAKNYSREGEYLVFTPEHEIQNPQHISLPFAIDYSLIQIGEGVGATAAILFNLSRLHFALGRDGMALQVLAKTLQLNPKSVKPYLLRSGIYRHRGEVGLAQDDINTAITLLPSLPSRIKFEDTGNGSNEQQNKPPRNKPPEPPANGAFGGIDFRSLPIVTQAISNLSIGDENILLQKIMTINLDEEWRDIERLVNSRIIPSAERIKEYMQSVSYQGSVERDKVILCISDILRIEEDQYCLTDPVLKDILVVLESESSSSELKNIFIGLKS